MLDLLVISKGLVVIWLVTITTLLGNIQTSTALMCTVPKNQWRCPPQLPTMTLLCFLKCHCQTCQINCRFPSLPPLTSGQFEKISFITYREASMIWWMVKRLKCGKQLLQIIQYDVAFSTNHVDKPFGIKTYVQLFKICWLGACYGEVQGAQEVVEDLKEMFLK